MRVSSVLLGFTVLFSAFAVAADEDTQGSFHGEVSDGSELVKYNSFLDRLTDWSWWTVLSIYATGSSTTDFKAYSSWREVFAGIVEENGGTEIPPYASDSLKLGGLTGYRKYAEQAMSNNSFVASAESCGASITYVVPSAVAVLLFDKRPAYRDGLNLSKDERLVLANQYGKQLNTDLNL